MDQTETQLAIWRLFLERCRARARLEEAAAKGDGAALAAAEIELASIPEISALDALKANAELIARLAAQRWIGMKVARDEGANLEEIGAQLGVSRQAAWEFLKKRIEEHGGDLDQGLSGAPVDADDFWTDMQRRINSGTGDGVEEVSWSRFRDVYSVGDVVTGTVDHVVPLGAFIAVDGVTVGLVPRSALNALPDEGERLDVRIEMIDDERRRVAFAPA
jgi:hypothetical protein